MSVAKKKGGDAEAKGVLPNVGLYVKAAERLARAGTDLEAVRAGLWYLRVADAVLDYFDATFATFGISDGKFNLLMLFVIDAFGGPGRRSPLSPSEMAVRLYVNRSTVTGLLDGLERAGLVVRTADPDDRRMLRGELTVAGRALMDRLLPVYWESVAALTAELSADERAALEKALGHIYRAVRERAAAAGAPPGPGRAGPHED